MTLSYKEALKIIQGLSRPSKMPWWSWSISAHDCITGSKLRPIPGSTCSSCYALKGNYNFSNVTAAHERRKLALANPLFVDAFVIVLNNLHARTRKRRASGVVENRFRWLDAGDIQSVKMLEQINEIAKRTPQIEHWLPTRELAFVKEFIREHGGFTPNLVVRLSAAMVDTEPKTQPQGLPYSVVGCEESTTVFHCPALAKQGNQCLECSACWSKLNISYPLH
jgi:hypothetical protein